MNLHQGTRLLAYILIYGISFFRYLKLFIQSVAIKKIQDSYSNLTDQAVIHSVFHDLYTLSTVFGPVTCSAIQMYHRCVYHSTASELVSAIVYASLCTDALSS